MLVEGFELLQKYGINISKYWVNEIPLHVNFPLVVKADLNHKTDVGAVRLNINDYSELKYYFEKFKEKFNTNIIIQEQITGDYTEMIIGIKYDITFGDICLVGIGGIYTELIKDFIILSLPFDIEILKNRLKELKFYKILEGYRNKPKVNIEILYDDIMKLYGIYKNENLKEIEINPLLINDKNSFAVDIRFLR
ncbi:MAG: acetate--CoA ligase family protein [Nanopusillaceae archaeon]